MALCWVKAGECGQETTIAAHKIDMTHVAFDITTTCEHIEALAAALGAVDVGHEMSCRLDETSVYKAAIEHVCRNSCVVPAAILKAMEVEAGLFLPGDAEIRFVEGML
jgi:hypothetical protein